MNATSDMYNVCISLKVDIYKIKVQTIFSLTVCQICWTFYEFFFKNPFTGCCKIWHIQVDKYFHSRFAAKLLGSEGKHFLVGSVDFHLNQCLRWFVNLFTGSIDFHLNWSYIKNSIKLLVLPGRCPWQICQLLDWWIHSECWKYISQSTFKMEIWEIDEKFKWTECLFTSYS